MSMHASPHLSSSAAGVCVLALCTASTAYGIGVPAPPAPVSPPQTGGFTQALVSGRANIELRPRYEYVHEDNSKTNAKAFTIRSRVGYTSQRWKALWIGLEGEAVSHLNDSDYFDTTNFSKVGTDSLVPDPATTEINQAYLGIHASTGPALVRKTQLRAGLQRLVLDNDRWIGDVRWRQNMQTLDAVSLYSTAIPHTRLQYAFVERANRIFGNDSVFQQYKFDAAHLINLAYQSPWGQWVGYAYLLDFKDLKRTNSGIPAPAQFNEQQLSTNTFGIRLTGARPLSKAFTLLYELEWAKQKDAYNNPLSIDEDYYLVQFGGKFKAGPLPLTLQAAREHLGGNGTSSLQTPLATVHAFNGWADKFVAANSTNPAQGLNDNMLMVATKVAGVKFVVAYHKYETDAGSNDYGDEWNFLAAKKYGKNWMTGFKFATFERASDNPIAGMVDTTKAWVWGEFQFN